MYIYFLTIVEDNGERQILSASLKKEAIDLAAEWAKTQYKAVYGLTTTELEKIVTENGEDAQVYKAYRVAPGPDYKGPATIKIIELRKILAEESESSE